MGKDHIGYDELVDNALRGAMRDVMLRVSENGLLGSHHLYITFRTGHPGVDIPSYLADRYPDELTIVLQHQYWGLEVTEEGFSVTLSFNKAREHVSIPFAALTRFADPGVKFGLQFESQVAARPGKLELVADPSETSDDAGSEEGASVEDGMTELSVGRNGVSRSFMPGAQEANSDDGAAESDDQEADGAGDGEAAEGEAPDAPDDSAESDGASADVVTLDSFRKK
ncbi:MAG: hypothetical protein HOM52_13795 [Rhodospirillaceae bacterium]|nr:hypothetical protein [Rhodospirillaceae bacterium]MBT5039574.1 hypothetical protein [Rhodospirillaceae bacterium]MBT5676847.1 hypothetical protein [Rhodospirillaceae bacterium]